MSEWFAKAMREAEEGMPPYERAVMYLRAAAGLTNDEIKNPIMARAARDCARRGLEALGEPIKALK